MSLVPADVAAERRRPDSPAPIVSLAQRVRAMASMARAPLIADGDTAHGQLLIVAHTVRRYEAAGAAAIQLEDQEFPKRGAVPREMARDLARYGPVVKAAGIKID